MKKLLFFLFITVVGAMQINASEISPSEQLHEAARRGDLKKVEQLLKSGADVNSENDQGETPLMQACYSKNTKIARLLLQHKADVNATSDVGSSPLIIACLGNSELVKLLLENKAIVDEKNRAIVSGIAWANPDERVFEALKAGMQSASPSQAKSGKQTTSSSTSSCCIIL